MNPTDEIDLSKNTVNIFINPFSYISIRKKSYLLENPSIKVRLDGSSLVFLSKLIFGKKVNRQSFDDTSLAPLVFEYCQDEGLPIALIGTKESTIVRAASLLISRYPRITIGYMHNGYFDEQRKAAVLQECLTAKCVIVGLGSPKQEEFLVDLGNLGWTGLGFTCGGYLDQLVSADGQNYYPYFFDKFNIRWLYRLVKEPRRLWRRYFLQYPMGLFLFIRDNFPYTSDARIQRTKVP